MADELSAREQGLQLGREYAVSARADRAKLRRVVRAETAAEVRANIDWSLLGAIDQERPVAFWSGFAHGVRNFLVDEAAAPSDEPATPRPGGPIDGGQAFPA